MDHSPTHTRDRIVREAMRLFADLGYAGTSVARIEAAAGLSAGSGGLYKHFPSKRHVLEEGVSRLLAASGTVRELLAHRLPGPEGGDLRQELSEIAKAGLERLEQERDFNRVLLRDLADFPDLLSRAGEEEIAGNHRLLAAWLTAKAGDAAPAQDWSAVAAVLIGATAHFWLLRDIFGGTHPTGVSEEAYIGAMSELAARLLQPTGDENGS